MRRLGDRFVVEEALGAGGMGSIHRGRDERLGAPVAIKLLKHALLEDPILRERFRREALSLAKLRHPGIVTVLDFGEQDGDLYTVLELVEGETIERVMERDGAMTVERTAPMFDQILAALEVCHDSEIVHRDIKPANLMVVRGAPEGDADRRERVKLIDFGLARMTPAGTTEKLTETGVVQGTPHYMAPEQCRGEDVGPEADIYSAGVVFYEMLAGSRPFEGSDAATFMAQHLFVDPPALQKVAPRVPAGIAAAIHAALAKLPGDRPTAKALRSALNAVKNGTDPESRGVAAADLRHHTSGLARAQRAIGTGDASAESAPVEVARQSANVVVWMTKGERSAALRSCLATGGLSCSLASATDAPLVTSEDIVVVVSASDGMDRVRRAVAAAPKVAVVVVDIDGPDQTTEAIRAGARDMLLGAAPDADLVPKLERLMRRARGRS